MPSKRQKYKAVKQKVYAQKLRGLRLVIWFYEWFAILSIVLLPIKAWYIIFVGVWQPLAVFGIAVYWFLLLRWVLRCKNIQIAKIKIKAFSIIGIIQWLCLTLTQYFPESMTQNYTVLGIYGVFSGYLIYQASTKPLRLYGFYVKLKIKLFRLFQNNFKRTQSRIVQFVLGCLCLGHIDGQNILTPFFLPVADLAIICIYTPLHKTPLGTWYDKQVKKGEMNWENIMLYMPFWLEKRHTQAGKKQAIQRIIHTSSLAYQIDATAYEQIITQESNWYFARLPAPDPIHPLTGGMELGITQLQPAWIENSIAWWPKFMHKQGVYNVFLEYQRARFLVFLCSFDVPIPFEILRSYIVASIDDRLSTDVFFDSAEILALHIKNKKPGQTNTDAMITGWYYGRPTNDKSLIRKYQKNSP